MPTFLNVEDLDLILAEANPGRRAGLVCRLYSDFDAGALDLTERHGAVSVFRAAARDPEITVRQRFARFVAGSATLPRDIAERLAADKRAAAAPILARSPVLTDAALIDLAADRSVWRQIAVASRPRLSVAVAAAIVEVASADACRALLANRGAAIPAFAFDRLQDRFPHDHAVREAMLCRPGVPARLVEDHAEAVAQRLGRFVAATGWLAPDRAARSARGALEATMIAVARDRSEDEMADLVGRWARSNKLTESLVVRTAFCGAERLLDQVLAVLCRLPVGRVRRLTDDRSGYGLRSVCTKAHLSPVAVRCLLRAARATQALSGMVAMPTPSARAGEPATLALRLGLIMDPAFSPDLPVPEEIEPLLDDVATQLRLAMAQSTPAHPPVRRAA